MIGDDDAVERELQDLVQRIGAMERPCWQPQCEERDGEPSSSKFCGVPLLAPGESWPACGNCARPMQLFVQLNSAELPVPSPFGEGVLQFFYCTDLECDTACEAWAPRAKSTLLRVVPLSAGTRVPRLPATAAFPPRAITGWRQVPDYPHWEDYEALGIDAPLYLADELMEARPTEWGDKLLGWPAWVQSAEYPHCSRCGAQMRVIFQVDSEDNVPFMFGDVGTGHISSCPDHPSELAFGWACS